MHAVAPGEETSGHLGKVSLPFLRTPPFPLCFFQGQRDEGEG